MKKFLAILLALVAFHVAMPNSTSAVFTFFIECKECGGSGRCSNCHGIGNIIEEYYDERVGEKVEHNKGPCRVCDGTGKCKKCKGSGKVPVSTIK